MKLSLYDRVIDFDPFSQYEIQNLFIKFLQEHKVFQDEKSLELKDTHDFLADEAIIFAKFAIFLLSDLQVNEPNYFTSPSLLAELENSPVQAKGNDAPAEDFRYKFQFYPMNKVGTEEPLDKRKYCREYVDVLGMVNCLIECFEDILQGRDLF